MNIMKRITDIFHLMNTDDREIKGIVTSDEVGSCIFKDVGEELWDVVYRETYSAYYEEYPAF